MKHKDPLATSGLPAFNATNISREAQQIEPKFLILVVDDSADNVGISCESPLRSGSELREKIQAKGAAKNFRPITNAAKNTPAIACSSIEPMAGSTYASNIRFHGDDRNE